MALPASFLDELRARTPMAGLVSRRVKLARSGKSWKGCCPFHNEKTASFYVYDDGYHCFGCGAHGDAIGFVMQTEAASFIDAVERLAAEAGLDVPKASPGAAEAERQRLDLSEVLDRAAASFTRRLHAPEGREALAYLRGRGLTDGTIQRFGLGWSGEGRGDLVAELGREGISPARLAEAGLLQSRDDGAVRELFYQRVMFPIRDRRGRTISFGGRALGDAIPKYINGPETALYSKSRTLYALDLAREGARKPPGLVVVEGYMDVIALHQAGFTGAVAPLGTALTPGQLEELWRLSDAPILCFDGDAAGGRAAARAAETALPMLAPDRTLCLVSLPSGEDPDSLVRRQGAAAFAATLAAKRPLSAVLFDLLREGAATDTPEARAALRARLDAAAARIADRTLAAEYRTVLRDQFFAGRNAARNAGRKGSPPPRPAMAARPSPPGDPTAERHRVLLAILLHHPDRIADVAEALSGLRLTGSHVALRDAILQWFDDAPVLDSAELMNHLTCLGHEAAVSGVLAARPVPLPACAGPGAMPAEAEAGWWHYFGLLNRARLEEEVAAAAAAFSHSPDAASQDRLVALCGARDALSHDTQADDTEA